MELTKLSLTEAASLLQRRQISSEELTGACLERIAGHDSEINAFITVTAGQALDQARQADRAAAQGTWLGRLHGVPIALKDLFETGGVRTTAGSRVLAGYVPSEDCTVYQKLRDAGAVLLGKTNMHEWAFGVTSQNPHYGAVRNPWDPSRIAGGSSGGSAAALAAGFCFGALGTDTGGSIRIPAALCGVVGLKPTYGKISTAGVIPLSASLDHVGPMGKTAEDVALLYAVVSNGWDRESQRFSESEPARLADALILDCASDPYFGEVDVPVGEAVREAASVFESLGAEVRETPFPGAEEALAANVTILLAEAAAYHRETVRSRPQDYSPDVLERLRRGAEIGPDELAQARAARRRLREQFIRSFDQFDILLTPTTPSAAIPIQVSDPLQAAPTYTRFTAPFNLAGLPALSVPCGLTPGGLPVGLQLVGPPGAERLLLAAARAFDFASGWRTSRSP